MIYYSDDKVAEEAIKTSRERAGKVFDCNGCDVEIENAETTECSKKTLNSKKCYDYVVLCIKHFSLSPCY
jgi:hypothetical protein